MGSRIDDRWIPSADWFKSAFEPDGILWDDNLVGLFSEREPPHWASDIPRHHTGLSPEHLTDLRVGDTWTNISNGTTMVFTEGGWVQLEKSYPVDLSNSPDMTGINVIQNDTIRNNERLFREFQEYHKKHINQIFKINEDV